MRRNSRALWLGVGLVCLLLSGCYRESVSEDVTTITYTWWITMTTIIVSVAAIIGGWMIREDEDLERLCWTLIGGGALGLLIVVPIMFQNKVTVDPQHFASKSGIWFFGSSHDIKFTEIHRMELRSLQSRRSVNYYLLCFTRQGKKVEVPVGTLMKPALPKILLFANANKVEFEDKSGH